MLFRESNNWENNAEVISGGQYYNMWDKYALSYKFAAETISSEILKDATRIDYLIYPLVYLYRHYFELRIKEIILTSSEYSNEEMQIPFHHDLNKLWLDTKKAIVKIRPEALPEDLLQVEQILHDFGEYDRFSMDFRYPFDKRNKPTLASLNYIDIKVFLKSIEAGILFLEDITRLISATIAFKDIVDT